MIVLYMLKVVPGADGERAGNFNMQNSDLLIIVGARMHVRQIGFDHTSFARQAKKSNDRHETRLR